MKKGSYPLLCVVSLFFFLISPWVEFHYYYIHFAIRFYIWHTLGVWLRAKWIQKTWQSGSPTPWISSIKEVGIVILAAQNYVIGCVKMILAHFSINWMESPICIKFLGAPVIILLTVLSSLIINRIFPFVTDYTILTKRWKKN